MAMQGTYIQSPTGTVNRMVMGLRKRQAGEKSLNATVKEGKPKHPTTLYATQPRDASEECFLLAMGADGMRVTNTPKPFPKGQSLIKRL